MVHPESAFLAGYALLLVVVAAGLQVLGRRPTHPWATRMLAAGRPPEAELAELAELDGKAAWPHSEVPAFHRGLSGVVLIAALLLTVTNLVRHHRLIEVVALLALLALIATRIARLGTERRRESGSRETGS